MLSSPDLVGHGTPRPDTGSLEVEDEGDCKDRGQRKVSNAEPFELTGCHSNRKEGKKRAGPSAIRRSVIKYRFETRDKNSLVAEPSIHQKHPLAGAGTCERPDEGLCSHGGSTVAEVDVDEVVVGRAVKATRRQRRARARESGVLTCRFRREQSQRECPIRELQPSEC